MRNLYFRSNRFRDFNFTDGLGKREPVCHATLLREIRQAYDLSECPDPCFVDTITLTLRMETASRYVKGDKALLKARDFLTSKLFQFLYDPLRIQNRIEDPGALPLRRQLELWLDGLPQSATARLYGFNWPAFFMDSIRLKRPRMLSLLDRYLPAVRRKQLRKPWMGRRGPVPDVRGYRTIEKAVRRIGKDWRRRPRLREVAKLLDKAEYAAPKSWAKLDPPVRRWRSAVSSHPKLVRKILEYRVARLREVSKRYRSLHEAVKEESNGSRD